MVEVKPGKLQEMYRALGNANRLKILLLCEEKGHSVTQLSKKLKISYNLVSEYVSILLKHDLISRTKNDDQTVTIRSLIKFKKNGEFKRKRN
jgi:predicted transcriptional regulator